MPSPRLVEFAARAAAQPSWPRPAEAPHICFNCAYWSLTADHAAGWCHLRKQRVQTNDGCEKWRGQ